MIFTSIFLLAAIGQVTSECLSRRFGENEVKFCSDSILYNNCTCKFEFFDVYRDCTIRDHNPWELSDIRNILVLDTVKEFRARTFKHLVNMERLTVDSVGLQKIHPTSFINLPNMERIHACNNHIARISYGIFSGTNFHIIDLRNNQIADIDELAFGNMSNLYALTLSQNRLKSINKNWFYESLRIMTLRLDFNYIETIESGTFEDLPLLRTVNLQYNHIHTIENNGFTGINLYELDLSGNNLTYIDASYFGYNMTTEHLYLGSNRIATLSENFRNSIQNMESLHIFPNPLLCHCIKDLAKWARMKKIDLMFNDIYDIDVIKHINFTGTIPLCIVPDVITLNLCDTYDERNYKFAMEQYFYVMKLSPKPEKRSCHYA